MTEGILRNFSAFQVFCCSCLIVFMLKFLIFIFCPTVPFCPNKMFRLEDYVWRKRIMSTIISPVARSNWCENAKKRHMIIFNRMQRFYFLICQSNWCQNASKLVNQKGEISFLWDIQKVVHWKCDFDVWHWTGRLQNSNGCENWPTPGVFFYPNNCRVKMEHWGKMEHFAPMFPDLLYPSCLMTSQQTDNVIYIVVFGMDEYMSQLYVNIIIYVSVHI